jgi:hypothetical protein
MPPPTKRPKRSQATHIDRHESESESQSTHSASEMSSSVNGRQSPDTEDEIAEARPAKSKKTLKRKHRATDPSNFGATLQSLLKTNAPSGVPLSLKPSVARRQHDEKLELKAKKLLKGERKSKEEVGRIRDVIGGWGVESERSLRKVAQRGGENCLHHPCVTLTDGCTTKTTKSSSCSMQYNNHRQMPLLQKKKRKTLGGLANQRYLLRPWTKNQKQGRERTRTTH